jgi:AhpD family alkylhydroperoxidase
MHEQRIQYTQVARGAVAAMAGLERYLAQSGLERGLLDLVKLRASQINGCAYCIDMHTKELRANGETEQRLYLLPVWRETSLFSDRECAALAWAEAVTRISETHAPDDVYEQARRQFGEKELVDLTLAVAAINGWNRLAISFRVTPGSYQPAHETVGTAAS